MIQWVLKRLEGYSPAYDRDQLIAVVATIIITSVVVCLNGIFAVIHLSIPELSIMNIVSVVLLIFSLYLILCRYKYVEATYLIILTQCYYIDYVTYFAGYDKDSVILYPVLIFAIYTIFKAKEKHIRNVTYLVNFSFILAILSKIYIIPEYNGELWYFEYVNAFYAIGTCAFVIKSKKIAEKFVDKYNEDAMSGISKEAYQDFLTGLWNRRFLEKEFSKLADIKFGVIILADVDFFKKVNDTYGHNTGDYVLRKVSKIYREVLRETDVICRWGGEEFLFLLIKNRGSLLTF